MAQFVKDVSELYKGSAKLWSTDKVESGFVVSSAIAAAFDTGRPETMVFEADAEGRVVNWIELALVQDAQDHDLAIARFDREDF